MKVLWMTSVYPSSEKPGEGVFHETQAQELRKLGAEMTVICPRPKLAAPFRVLKKTYRQKDIRPAHEWRRGVSVHRPFYQAVPGQLKWAQPHKRMALSVLSEIKNHGLKPDLIHAHFAMPSGGAAAIVSKALGIPYVLTLHGSDVNVYPHYSKSAHRAFTFAVREAADIYAVSGSLREQMKKLIEAECSVLPIGITLDAFRKRNETKEAVRKRLGLPPDRKLIVFIGRLVKEKGVFDLSKAVQSLDERYEAVFVGDGPAESSLREAAHIVTGQVPNDKVQDYLLASDVMALPSYSEGMPTVVIEALALKVPVICTDVGGLASLFGKHRGLLIKPGSPDTLAESILQYDEGEAWTPQTAEELSQTVRTYFDASHNAKALKEKYRSVMNRAGQEENLSKEG
ncbi:glycosyltransferase family 4 protein [Bacillus velezensis]|uniref:teichuronic acid biosynthesis protein TuaC n=1 Tax=Bacillus TaxID=1386 RepID=UPI000C81C70D|nr:MULTISPECIES: glycosyltransferase family 4 protein [Bacillus]MBA5710883.1 glycosyltransferase family 4 protein [Bacillus velezensis]MBT0955231.1 glycosyltransferase family 4 protein [Bacillus velezensis]MCC9264837.1 glycosyltransferase family 4 protein [Bacillus velezensis]MCD7910423.1 glycosyltransferase family 4 protein [Bacillus velezensis]MCQ9193448.1 glycosyltransferase family 4 protein [Bacillus velezensis]